MVKKLSFYLLLVLIIFLSFLVIGCSSKKVEDESAAPIQDTKIQEKPFEALSVCGDRMCDPEEYNANSCPQDCEEGEAAAESQTPLEKPESVCGDRMCDPQEYNANSCPQDCKEEVATDSQTPPVKPESVCGDRLCDPEEYDAKSCPQDCEDI